MANVAFSEQSAVCIFFFSISRRPRCVAAVCWFPVRGCVFPLDDACQKRFSWFPDWIQKVKKRVHLVDLVKRFQMSIYYFVAKIGVNTQKYAKKSIQSLGWNRSPQQRSQEMHQWESRMEKELPNHAKSNKNALDRFGTTESIILWSEFMPICWYQGRDDWTGNCTLRNWLLTHLNGLPKQRDWLFSTSI